MRQNFLAVSLLSVSLAGCGSMPMTNAPYMAAAEYYQENKHEVRLGMTEKEFAHFIAPAEAHYKKYDYVYREPDRFTRGNHVIDVWYVLSRYIRDQQDTDDEYTPHIFVDGKLAAIGWEHLGGTKRTSQDVAREQAAIEAAAAGRSRTVVNQSSGGSQPEMMEVPIIQPTTTNVRIVP